MSMSNTNFTLLADGGPDDLPRTLRREREARERAAKELAAKEAAKERGLRERDTAPGAAFSAGERDYSPAPAFADAPPATVQRFDVPFLHLIAFFLKAVVAAIPALVLLGVILWFAGHTLQTLFPELVKMQILIRFPNG